MAKIAVIIENLFEDSEYTEPMKALQEAGHELVNIGLKAGETVKGKKKETPVQIDMAFREASVNDFDALLIPGGSSSVAAITTVLSILPFERMESITFAIAELRLPTAQ